MGTIHCRGGHTFSDGLIPCPNEYHLIPNSGVDGLVDKILATVEAGEDIGARIFFLIATGGPTTYKCPICGRLLVFWDGIEKRAKSYKLEE